MRVKIIRRRYEEVVYHSLVVPSSISRNTFIIPLRFLSSFLVTCWLHRLSRHSCIIISLMSVVNSSAPSFFFSRTSLVSRDFYHWSRYLFLVPPRIMASLVSVAKFRDPLAFFFPVHEEQANLSYRSLAGVWLSRNSLADIARDISRTRLYTCHYFKWRAIAVFSILIAFCIDSLLSSICARKQLR